MPPGSTRYWSWLFAAREAREPLLGMFALMAEWRALMDPRTEVSAMQTKLLWWREEMDRLAAGSPVHPITRYLADFPRALTIDFAPLARSVEAVAAQVAGVPLERGAELEAHAHALYGQPLLIAAQLSDPAAPSVAATHSVTASHGIAAAPRAAPPTGERTSLRSCVAPLAAAEYLSRAIADYAREAGAGRVPFAVDELLAAEIENADLVAAEPPPRLRAYLDTLRQKAAGYYSNAAAALAPEERPPLRHLLVLATLGAKHLSGRKRRTGADFRVADLYNAWSAARRAATAR